MTAQPDYKVLDEIRAAYKYGYDRATKGLSKEDCYLDDYAEALNHYYYQKFMEMLPGKRKLIEPVTKRPVTEIGDKVGIDLDADIKGSLKFIQDNGYNQALSDMEAKLKLLGAE